MTEMIVLDDLTKRFGAFTAVDGISLTVGRGEVLGFLGPNGAGKSTTMKMVAGYLTPTSGNATVSGHDVVADPLSVKRAIGYLPEGAPTYGDMTVEKFLAFIAEIRGFDGAARTSRVHRAVELAALEHVTAQTIDTLSKGFKRRVGLAQAILHDPDVLIMDEPTDGLDPNQKHHVRTLIQEMSADKAIIISTHILEEVEAVCTRATVIANGRLVADGTPADLIARDPQHNAVVLKLAPEAVAGLRADLDGLEGVARIDDVPGANGTAEVRVLAKPGLSIAVEVGEVVRAKGILVDEIFVERGTLDSVFRDITQGTPDVRAEEQAGA